MSRLDEARYRAAEQALFEALGVEVEERWVEIDAPRTRLRVLAAGGGEGEPVLFVHGSPNASPTWVTLAAALGRPALLLERPGAGLSAPVRRWGDYRREVVAMVEAALDQLGLDQVDLVGSSFGGLYAYYLAIDAPHRVRRLVQMSGPAGPLSLRMPGIFRPLSVMHLLPGASRFAPRPDVEQAKAMYRDIGHGPSIASGAIHEAWFPWYSALLCHTDTMAHLFEEVRALATPFGYRGGRGLTDAELAGLAMPVLYLWGTEDPFGSPDEGAALAALTPGARFERFEGMGHIPWMDSPEIIARRLRAFLDEAPSAAAQSAT